MKPRIEQIGEIKLIGTTVTHSMTNMKYDQLWNGFMPRSAEVRTNLEKPRMVQASIYDICEGNTEWTNDTEFRTMAAYEVKDFGHVPDGMEKLTVGGGKFAVFTYKGTAAGLLEFYKNIFENWLQENKLEFDVRSDFEIYDHRFVGPMNPDSEWDICIPVK